MEFLAFTEFDSTTLKKSVILSIMIPSSAVHIFLLALPTVNFNIILSHTPRVSSVPKLSVK
jgi:hypothetical protein